MWQRICLYCTCTWAKWFCSILSHHTTACFKFALGEVHEIYTMTICPLHFFSCWFWAPICSTHWVFLMTCSQKHSCKTSIQQIKLLNWVFNINNYTWLVYHKKAWSNCHTSHHFIYSFILLFFWPMKFYNAALKYFMPVGTDSSDLRLKQNTINIMSTFSSHNIHFSRLRKHSQTTSFTQTGGGTHQIWLFIPTVLTWWLVGVWVSLSSVQRPWVFHCLFQKKLNSDLYTCLRSLLRFLLHPNCNGPSVAMGDNGRRKMAGRR